MMQNDQDLRRQALIGQLGGEAPPPAGYAPKHTGQLGMVGGQMSGIADQIKGIVNPQPSPMLGGAAEGLKGLAAPGIQAPGGTPPAAPPAASPSGLGQFAGKLEGFDSGKLNSEHNSPKYAFGRTMSQFDPKGGITQEMLDALNKLGMGTVSGKIGGDKISVGGQIDPRFEGVTEFDIIRDLENGGGWQWGGLNGPAASPQAGPSGPGGPVHPLLMGDANSQIAAALQQYQEPSSNLKALLAQLGQV